VVEEQEVMYEAPKSLDEFVKRYTGHARYHNLLKLARGNKDHRVEAIKLCMDLAKKENKLK
jgi:hypothetical protein